MPARTANPVSRALTDEVVHGRSVPSRVAARARVLWQVPSFRHFTLPALTGAVLLALFFSGNRVLATIVVPEVNREFGLLEHLQLLPLAGIAVLAARVRAVERATAWRVAMFVAMAGAAFMLLEELNYGQHYVALPLGRGSEADVGPMSLHNVSDTTDLMKAAGDLAMALLFVVVPVASRLTRRQLLGEYTPGTWYLASMFLLVASGTVAVELSRAGLGPGWLRYNLSEFRELFIYHTGLLYAWDVSRVRLAKSAMDSGRGNPAGTLRVERHRSTERVADAA